MVYSGQFDVHRLSRFVPMGPRRDQVADLYAERFGRRSVQHRFDGEFGPAVVADGVWASAFNDLRIRGFVCDGHTLDSTAVALDELVAILVDEIWLCDGWAAWAVA